MTKDRSAALSGLRPQTFLTWLILSAPAAAVLWCGLSAGFSFADSAFLGFGETQPFSLVHFATNAFSSWSFIPGIDRVFGRLGYSGYASSLMLVFAFGAAKWLRWPKPECGCRFHEALLIAAFGLITLRWFGIDVVLLSLLACIPLLLAGAKDIIERDTERMHEYVLLGLASALNCLLCHQLAIISALAVFLILVFEGWRREPGSRLPCIFVVLFVPAFAASLFSSVPVFPHYESKGHLVPIYGVVDGLQPLVGSAPRLNAVDRQYVRAAIAPAALLLSFISGLLIFCERIVRGPGEELLTVKAERRAAPIGAFVFAVAAFFDSDFVSGTTSQLAPVQSLGRIVPGLYFFPTSIYLLAIALLLLIAAAARETVAKLVVAIVMVAAILPISGTFGKTADRQIWTEALSEPDLSLRNELLRKLNSPSYYVIRELGLDIVKHRTLPEGLTFRSAAELQPTMSASAGSAQINLLVDGKDTTRWTAGGARQVGTEWVRLRFPEPVTLAAVRLETGRYFTDFPRGIQLRSAEFCPEDQASAIEYKTVFRRAKNEGDILYTPDGFPFFAEQYNLTIPFLVPVRTQCLLVEQIGRESNYEWSVSELELATAAPSNIAP